jgi:hypothetical protein
MRDVPDESDQTPLTQLELGIFHGCGFSLVLIGLGVLVLLLKWAGVL